MGNVLRSCQHGWQIRNRWEFSVLIGVVVLAFGTRVAVAILTTSWVFPSDRNFWQFGYEMGQLAASLAMGNGFSWPDWSSYPQGPTAWMPPVYPLIMAAVFKIFGIFSQEAALVLIFFQTIISSLACILLYLLGKRLYNAQVGLLAAFLLAMYPANIHFGVQKICSTSLFTFCLLLVILMFQRQVDHPNVKRGMRLGIILGFTALVNPIIVGALPFAFAWLYLKADGSRDTIIKTLNAMLIVFCLVISPWLVRNYIVFEQFVFIKSNLGNELFVGNNEFSTGGYEDALNGGKNISRILTEAEGELLKRSGEATRNRFLLRKAITFIVEHPSRFAKHTMTRFGRYWTYVRPTEGWQAKIALITYLIVLALATTGLFLRKAKGRGVQLVLLFLLSLPIPYYFTIVIYFRYRLPIEPLLMIFAAQAIYWIASQSHNILARTAHAPGYH